MMSQRACNLGLEVLDDLTSFFECSPEFISVPCEKLRRTQGNQFNNKVVAALMALRTDLERSERKEAIRICEEIIRQFRDDPAKKKDGKGGTKNQGLFAVVEEMDQPKNASKQKGGASKIEEEKKGGAAAANNNFVLTDSDEMSDEDDEMNMSAFMREGGLDEDIADRKKKAKEEEEERKRKEEAAQKAVDRAFLRKSAIIKLDSLPSPRDTVEDIMEEEKKEAVHDDAFDSKPSDRMEGFMLVRKTKLDKKTSALPGFSTPLTANFKRYFSIRAGILYQYERKTSREMMDRFKVS